MIDDPYKLLRDILVNSAEVTKIIPAKNIRNMSIPADLLDKPPYIRITVLEMDDVEYADGQIRAASIYYQVDIWRTTGLVTLGNKIKKLLKENGITFVDGLELHEEQINPSLTLYRDARRYLYSYELPEEDIY